MPNKEAVGKKGDLWLGTTLLGASILVVVFSFSIKSIGLGDNFDPGPTAFPLGLSALLAIGGFIELWQCRRPGISGTGPSIPETRSPETNKQKTVLLLLGAFLIYVILLPWLGFAIATLVMATGMMVLLGNSWKQSAIVSIILIMLIYCLFVLLFKVPLPGGVLNLPF